MTEMLSQRALNRATLARQYLLDRAPVPAIDAIGHLAGMQSQAPLAPYLGLWTRLRDFAPGELSALTWQRKVVRLHLMRNTVHLVTARDCLDWRALFYPLHGGSFSAHFRHGMRGVDRDSVLEQAKRLLAERPRTRAELGRLLAHRRLDAEPAALAYAATHHLALCQLQRAENQQVSNLRYPRQSKRGQVRPAVRTMAGRPELLHPDASGNLDWASVYTIDEFSNDLQETYLPNTGFPGDPWITQDLSAKYGTPPAYVLQSSQASWSVAHLGYTSAYTVDASNQHLEETYLPHMGGSWSTQDLSAGFGTPTVAKFSAPVALVHDGYTSVYTVDASNGDLQETYLPAAGFPGDPWNTQDLSANYGTPPVKPGTSPVAVFHDGFTSVWMRPTCPPSAVSGTGRTCPATTGHQRPTRPRPRWSITPPTAA